MYDIFKILLHRRNLKPKSDKKSTPTGYYEPQDASSLISSHFRAACLHSIWQNSNLPVEVYSRLCLEPIKSLLCRVQNVPGAGEGKWSGKDGFGDMILQYTSYAVRLAKGNMFPPGAAPEDQAAQGSVWQLIIFWQALFHNLPILASIKGELLNGACWYPGLYVPTMPFRFRTNQNLSGINAQAFSSMVANAILPEDATEWVCSIPGGLEQLSGAIWDRRNYLPVIAEILDEAMKQTGISPPDSKILGSETGVSDSIALISPVNSVIEIEGKNVLKSEKSGNSENSLIDMEDMLENVPIIQPVSTGDDKLDETDALLSMFAEEISSSTDADDKFVAILSEAEPHLIKEEVSAVKEQVKVNNELSNNSNDSSLGSVFLTWLTTGVSSGSIDINGPESRIHVVAGFVFLCVPDIFWLFIRENGESHSKEDLQRAFEKLKLHRVRKGQRFTQARIYLSQDKSGKFKKVNGYLVKAVQIFNGNRHPESQFILFPE